jgi:hypothetical protein
VSAHFNSEPGPFLLPGGTIGQNDSGNILCLHTIIQSVMVFYWVPDTLVIWQTGYMVPSFIVVHVELPYFHLDASWQRSQYTARDLKWNCQHLYVIF